MNMHDEPLGKDLSQLAGLLRKYGHHGYATVVEQIITTLETSNPDYERLAGTEMWGGSGPVWQACLTPSRTSGEAQEDEKSCHQTIIRIAATMDRLKIGTERSRCTAKIFQEWLDKGTI
jgi:hypothetical protein